MTDCAGCTNMVDKHSQKNLKEILCRGSQDMYVLSSLVTLTFGFQGHVSSGRSHLRMLICPKLWYIC